VQLADVDWRGSRDLGAPAFTPAQSRTSAFYLDPGNPRVGQPQISGVSADLAWKLSIGEQTTAVAICETESDGSARSFAGASA